MAQFYIVNAIIQKISKGQNAGKDCVVCDIKSTNFWDRKVVRRVFFDQYVIEALRQFITVDKGGTAQQPIDIPSQFQMTGCFVNWTPLNSNGTPRPFYKKHLSDHPELGLKAGDFVRNKTTHAPNVYTSLQIFCMYEKDEFGNQKWLGGEDPDTVGQAAFDAYCVPIDTINTPQPALNEEEIINATQGNTVIPPQPQTAQPQQAQFVQQPGQGQQPQQRPQFIQQPNVAQF